MAIATKGTFLIACVPIMIVYQRIERYIRRAAVEMQRLDSVSR